MKKFLAALIFILCFAGSAFSKEDTEIIFKGNLKIVQNGKESLVKKTKNIPIPKLEKFETQDDHPIVMAGMFNEKGYAKSTPVITVKTSKPFTLSCNRISGVFYLGEDYNGDELVPWLLQIGGEKSPFKIPAVARDYYVQVEMTEKELEDLIESEGVEYDDGKKYLDYGILQYFKMRVTK